MTCIPFAVIGGVLVLLMRGYNFNVSAGVGFVSLFGVSVMAGVLLVSAYQKFGKLHPELSFKELILYASKHELKPIAMMLLVAIVDVSTA